MNEKKDVIKAYGLWSGIQGFDCHDKPQSFIRGHDGDFFPEGPDGYIERMRNCLGSTQKVENLEKFYGALKPVRVDIDIIHRCSSRCYFCYSRCYAESDHYHNALISYKTFERLLYQLKAFGVQSIRFTGGGDPLVHPDVYRMIRLASRLKFFTTLITNGDRLTSASVDIISQHVDHFRVSLNAATQNTREQLHGKYENNNSLSRILDYITKIKNSRDSYQNRLTPCIWTTFLLLPENYTEIYSAAKLAQRSGADSISFRPLYHGLSREFSEKETQSVRKELERAKQLHDPNRFFVFTPKRDFTKAWAVRPKTNFGFCLSCRLRTVIEARRKDLAIKICGLHRGDKGAVLAGFSPEKNSFSEIWFDHKVIEKMIRISSNCRKCIDISMNVTVGGILKELQNDPSTRFHRCFIPPDRRASPAIFPASPMTV